MGKKIIYVSSDIILMALSVMAAVVLRFDLDMPENFWGFVTTLTPVAVFLVLLFSVLYGSYTSVFAYFGFSEMFKQLKVSVSAASVMLIMKYTFVSEFSGSLILMSAGLFFLSSSSVRAYERVKRWYGSNMDATVGLSKRILIVGAGKSGALIVKKCLDDNNRRFPVGIIDDDEKKHGQKISGVKVLGSVEKIAEYSKKLYIDEIIIAIPSSTDEERFRLFDEAIKANVPIKIFDEVVDIEDYHQGSKHYVKDVSIEDLLFRPQKNPDSGVSKKMIKGKTVLVTGGAGSIGSELCRQILKNGCQLLLILDINENELYKINEELKDAYEDRYYTLVASVRDKKRLKNIFEKYKPDFVFHAAAHKHVPMMEINPFEAIKNNVFGTLNVVEQSIASKVKKFVMISTDKAVRPTNVMGATKRICELIVKANSGRGSEMVAVRFGNVLGSNGSVIPLFKQQINAGGPVTVTHKDISRYFMTINEAVSLVLTAAVSAKGDELFVLDMGKPIRIYELAEKLIKLSGRQVGRDIEIKITGLRQGEKLFEELMLDNETVSRTSNKKIFIINNTGVDATQLKQDVKELSVLIEEESDEFFIREKLLDIVKEYEEI